MSSIHNQNKAVIAKYREALYNLEPSRLLSVMKEVFAEDCVFHMCFPFGDMTGPEEYYNKVFLPMLEAMPDLERRDYIDIAGDSHNHGNWVGSAGYWIGVFEKHWLDIPPSCAPVAMRYHEFFRVEEDKVVEFQGIWDMIHFMKQADAWPLSPSLGVDWVGPAPAIQNGLNSGERDKEKSEATCRLIIDMLDHLILHPKQGPEAMELEKFWHPKMTWYGPAGIGTNRRISGFRNWHQIPFLKAMPDRGSTEGLDDHFFGDGNFAAATGWPNMQMVYSADGWLGLPPVGKKIGMRSLDFWREEGGLIRENWVLVDILDVYDQLGVDVFNRMREMTVARQLNKPSL